MALEKMPGEKEPIEDGVGRRRAPAIHAVAQESRKA